MILKNTPITSLEEIERGIPSYYLDYDDYMALQRFVADEMDFFVDKSIQIINNAFIFRADEETIDDLQRFIGISDIKERIVNRSIYINGVLTSIGKLSVSKLVRWIEAVLGEKPTVYFAPDDNGNRILHIEVGNHPELLNDLITLITTRLPAGITVVSESKEDMEMQALYFGSGVMFENGYETIPINENTFEQDLPEDLTSEQFIGIPTLDAGFITLKAPKYTTYGALKAKTYGDIQHKTYEELLHDEED